MAVARVSLCARYVPRPQVGVQIPPSRRNWGRGGPAGASGVGGPGPARALCAPHTPGSPGPRAGCAPEALRVAGSPPGPVLSPTPSPRAGKKSFPPQGGPSPSTRPRRGPKPSGNSSRLAMPRVSFAGLRVWEGVRAAFGAGKSVRVPLWAAFVAQSPPRSSRVTRGHPLKIPARPPPRCAAPGGPTGSRVPRRGLSAAPPQVSGTSPTASTTAPRRRRRPPSRAPWTATPCSWRTTTSSSRCVAVGSWMWHEVTWPVGRSTGSDSHGRQNKEWLLDFRVLLSPQAPPPPWLWRQAPRTARQAGPPFWVLPAPPPPHQQPPTAHVHFAASGVADLGCGRAVSGHGPGLPDTVCPQPATRTCRPHMGTQARAGRTHRDRVA